MERKRHRPSNRRSGRANSRIQKNLWTRNVRTRVLLASRQIAQDEGNRQEREDGTAAAGPARRQTFRASQRFDRVLRIGQADAGPLSIELDRPDLLSGPQQLEDLRIVDPGTAPGRRTLRG